MMRIKSLAIAAIVILAAPVAAGCGSDDDDGDGGEAAAPAPTATQTATQPPAADRALTIRMTEFAFDPNDAVAKAGRVTITAPNDGKVVHELVLLKTDEDPAALPKKGDEVDESTSCRRDRRRGAGIDQEGDVQARAGKLRDGLCATGPLRGRHVWIADGRVAGSIGRTLRAPRDKRSRSYRADAVAGVSGGNVA